MIWPCWLIVYSSGEIGESDNDDSGGMEEDNMYKDSSKELVLALLSNLYSELEAISISASRLFSCPILYCLLTTYTTNYCFKEKVNNFGLRRLFYSKQDFKNAWYFLV